MDSHHCQKIRLFFLPVICGCAITTHSHKGNGFSPVSLVIQDNTAVLELSTLLSALRILCSFTLRILLLRTAEGSGQKSTLPAGPIQSNF